MRQSFTLPFLLVLCHATISLGQGSVPGGSSEEQDLNLIDTNKLHNQPFKSQLYGDRLKLVFEDKKGANLGELGFNMRETIINNEQKEKMLQAMRNVDKVSVATERIKLNKEFNKLKKETADTNIINKYQLDLENAKLASLKDAAEKHRTTMDEATNFMGSKIMRTKEDTDISNELEETQEGLDGKVKAQNTVAETALKKLEVENEKFLKISKELNTFEQAHGRDPLEINEKAVNGKIGSESTDTKLIVKSSKDFEMTRGKWIWVGIALTLMSIGITTLAGGFDSILYPHAQSATVVVNKPSFKKILQEECVGIQATAARIEEIAKERSPKTWNSTMNAMGSVYALAYQQAHQAGIKKLKELDPTSWGPAADSIPPPYIPPYTSIEDRNNITDTHVAEQKHWVMTELFRPIRLQLDLTQQHYEFVHQAAYEMMQQSNDLPYDSHSKYFTEAYAVHFARLSFPSQCSEYVLEPRETVKRFAGERVEQALRDSETYAVIDDHFAARLELSPPVSIPAVLASPPKA